ncbi:LysR substrate-binding domain-containing protein [Noviherbaspirillum humi]|nr:LysR substrate-binding domain-containing protein [Noviherbaspirillum humi]
MPHALRIMEALDGAAASVDMADEKSAETVQIGALPSVAPDVLPPALKRFRQLHADARVVIHTAANQPLLEMLKAGEIDFAVGRMSDPQMTVGLTFELLYMEPLALLVREGHPLSAAGNVTLSDVLAHPLVVSPTGTVPRHHTESFVRSQGFRMPDNCVETLSVALAQRLVRDSDSVWFAPLGVLGVNAGKREAGLERLPLATTGTEEPVGLLRRAEVGLPQAVQEFIEVLRSVSQERQLSAA